MKANSVRDEHHRCRYCGAICEVERVTGRAWCSNSELPEDECDREPHDNNRDVSVQNVEDRLDAIAESTDLPMKVVLTDSASIMRNLRGAAEAAKKDRDTIWQILMRVRNGRIPVGTSIRAFIDAELDAATAARREKA